MLIRSAPESGVLCVPGSERECHTSLPRSIEAREVVSTMEYGATRKALPALLVLSCLLLPLVSCVPLSRSVSLRNLHQGSASGLEAPVQCLVAKVAQERSLGEVAARMVIEVNDYPGSGANNRHDPKSPGRP